MSAPASVLATYRLTPDERDTLRRMAEECHVTVSFALREGAKLYLQELRAGRIQHPDVGHA